jgi:Domain of unknown function (DUF397)
VNVEDQDPTAPRWSAFRKSSFSANGGCVEVSMSTAGDVLLKDSKLTESPVLHFSQREWTAFLAGLDAGDFDFSAEMATGSEDSAP